MNTSPTPDRQPPRVKQGLARKVFYATFPVIFGIVLLTQLAVGYLNYQEQWEFNASRAQLTARLTAAALARPVWNLDRPVFEAQIRAIERDETFRYALLLDEKGAKLFELGAQPTDGRFIKVSTPVMEPGGQSHLGEFVLVVSTAHLLTSAYRQAVIGLLAIGVLLAGFFTTLHRATRRLVARPLDRLLAAMARVERKDWQKVDWRADDELGQVTAAFNRMVDHLKSGDEAKRLLDELQKAQASLLEKNSQLQKANRLILESIQYARRIQTAMLPAKQALGGEVADLHVAWEPLHLVGGDYYWLEKIGDQCLLAVMDCTGHGVPGAFMTLVVASALDNILHESHTLSPGEILRSLDRMVRARLRQDLPHADSDDGLEAAVCLWDPARRTLTFAGAGLPLLCAGPQGLHEIRGDRDRLGYRTLPPQGAFTEHTLAVRPGDAFYLLSDGVPDQMGGPDSPPRLLGRKRLAQIITPVWGQPMARQWEHVQAELAAWRGPEPRRDDLTLIGFVPLA
ncbi:MAG: SpoIIE family protein phosphatase [Deltaproteobacteria bacterium]|nr:SpoIIE family protein phosphatase [Deltaproteobacteria bacterium]